MNEYLIEVVNGGTKFWLGGTVWRFDIPQPQFVHVVCWLCHGRRYVAADTFTAERDEPCTNCAGKGTIVTEREEDWRLFDHGVTK